MTKKTDVNEDNKLKQTNDVYKNKTTNLKSELTFLG